MSAYFQRAMKLPSSTPCDSARQNSELYSVLYFGVSTLQKKVIYVSIGGFLCCMTVSMYCVYIFIIIYIYVFTYVFIELYVHIFYMLRDITYSL